MYYNAVMWWLSKRKASTLRIMYAHHRSGLLGVNAVFSQVFNTSSFPPPPPSGPDETPQLVLVHSHSRGDLPPGDHHPRQQCPGGRAPSGGRAASQHTDIEAGGSRMKKSWSAVRWDCNRLLAGTLILAWHQSLSTFSRSPIWNSEEGRWQSDRNDSSSCWCCSCDGQV